jgi:hypothetical protein
MLYALMLYSGALAASLMLCFTGDCVCHLITVAACSFIIMYLIMSRVCAHAHVRTLTHTHARVRISSQQSKKFNLVLLLHVCCLFDLNVISLEDLTVNVQNMVV